VILRANRQFSTLLDFHYRQHYHARRGQHGRGKNQHGRNAPDLTLPVPLGTLVREAGNGELLKDFTVHDESYIAARGGRGGRGNARFATSTNQAPRHVESGESGECRWLTLELKLMADVGIIGYPNVGKSSLIAKISAARPKIADYPFTTLVPNLGIVRWRNSPPFVVADIPGIIAGAHRGAGLGLRFLRHVERTTLLLHLLDMSEIPKRDPITDYEVLNQEMSLFDPGLSQKPQMVALNKMDTPEAVSRLPAVRSYFRKSKIKVYPVSALTGEGLPALLAALVRQLHQKRNEA
jgi:GTP-binding protein